MLLNSHVFRKDASHSTFVMVKVMANFSKIETKAERYLVAKDSGSPFPESTPKPEKKGP